MQRERVEDQYPWTWEIPLAVVCAIVFLGVAVCQVLCVSVSADAGVFAGDDGVWLGWI